MEGKWKPLKALPAKIFWRELRKRMRRPRPVPLPDVPLDAIFPPITNPRQRFLDECAGNLTEVFQTADGAGSIEALRTILSAVPPGEVYVQGDAKAMPPTR